MSLKTDLIFVKALRSNQELMAQLPAGDVYNTTIPVPDAELDNTPVPYVIVMFNGLQNGDQTKDSQYEGGTDHVQIGIEVVADTRDKLADLVTSIRRTVRTFFENAQPTDEDFDLIPIDYTFSAERIFYDDMKPAYGQMLNYQCDMDVTLTDDDNEQEN